MSPDHKTLRRLFCILKKTTTEGFAAFGPHVAWLSKKFYDCDPKVDKLCHKRAKPGNTVEGMKT